MDADQPDKAYVQYLRASEITVNIIPHHPEYRVAAERPEWHKEFADLMMVCSSRDVAILFFLKFFGSKIQSDDSTDD